MHIILPNQGNRFEYTAGQNTAENMDNNNFVNFRVIRPTGGPAVLSSLDGWIDRWAVCSCRI